MPLPTHTAQDYLQKNRGEPSYNHAGKPAREVGTQHVDRRRTAATNQFN